MKRQEARCRRKIQVDHEEARFIEKC